MLTIVGAIRLSRRHLQVGVVLATGVPNGGAEGSVLDEGVPPQRGWRGSHLFGYSQRQMEPGSSNPHRAAEHPGSAGRALPCPASNHPSSSLTLGGVVCMVAVLALSAQPG